MTRSVYSLTALAVALASAPATVVAAAALDLSIEVPSLKVAEYHRPYVAAWIEKPDYAVAANLAVWYQQTRAEERPKPEPGKPGGPGGGPGGGEGGGHDGTKWLKDLRQWWRRSGRTQRQFPIDGVSGATRPEGTHTLNFSADAAPLKDLPPGAYRLVVEAAREVGGRELLKIAFDWPPTAELHLTAQGQTELGAIALDLRP